MDSLIILVHCVSCEPLLNTSDLCDFDQCLSHIEATDSLEDQVGEVAADGLVVDVRAG